MRPIAVVTGASGGIGAAVVGALVRDGYLVHAADRVATDLGPHVVSHEVDLVDPDAIAVALDGILDPPSVLVNAAGLLVPGEALSSTPDDWQRTFAVNLFATVDVSTRLGRVMAQSGSGSIITIGSNAAAVPRWGMAAYAASKSAVASFTTSLGLELAAHGVRCNVVAPGSTDTAMLRVLSGEADPIAALIEGSAQRYRLGIPLGRVATPTDVAECVAFLASPAARHITLQTLTVDGGATLGA